MTMDKTKLHLNPFQKLLSLNQKEKRVKRRRERRQEKGGAY
jgi:hypothetical protein